MQIRLTKKETRTPHTARKHAILTDMAG